MFSNHSVHEGNEEIEGYQNCTQNEYRVRHQADLGREGLPRGPVVSTHTATGAKPQVSIRILEDGPHLVIRQTVFGREGLP